MNTPGVIGLGGAGVLGVDNAVGLARAHPAAIKSLVRISGETFGEGLQFLRQAAQLPGLSWSRMTMNIRPRSRRWSSSTSLPRAPQRSSSTSLACTRPWLWYEPEGAALPRDHRDHRRRRLSAARGQQVGYRGF